MNNNITDHTVVMNSPMKKAIKKYAKTTKGKMVREKYRQSEKGVAAYNRARVKQNEKYKLSKLQKEQIALASIAKTDLQLYREIMAQRAVKL
jgi:hypothetical protein